MKKLIYITVSLFFVIILFSSPVECINNPDSTQIGIRLSQQVDWLEAKSNGILEINPPKLHQYDSHKITLTLQSREGGILKEVKSMVPESFSLDLKGLPKGEYYISLCDHGVSVTEKIILD